MSRLSNQQLQQQWFSKLTPEQQQQVRLRFQAQRDQHQNAQLQGQQQQQALRQGQLSPSQQQPRQQQDGQQRSSSVQFSGQSSSPIAPTSRPNQIGGSSQPQASHPSLSSTVSSTNSLSGANIVMATNGQRQSHNGTQSSALNSTNRMKPHTSSSPSAPSTKATSGAAPAPSNASSPTRNGNTVTLSPGSHMPSVLRSMQTQNGSSSQHRQQVNASAGSTQTHRPRMPPPNAARHQHSPPKQGQQHANMNQQPSPAQQGSSPSARPASYPATTSHKRRATDAPDGAVHADKRQGMMPSSATRFTPTRQNNSASHQPGPYHFEQQKRLAEQRAREQKLHAAEEARAIEAHRITLAAALKRETDDKRREELRKDPSANYRHILEVYRLSLLDSKKGEYPNRYLTGLLANRTMPIDLDCDLALAIVYAKDHWDYYGQWPKDIKRFAEYERGRRDRIGK